MDRRELLLSPLRARTPGAAAAPGLGASPAPPRLPLSESDARHLSGRILALTGAEGARVNLAGEWRGNTRYAVNRITTSGEATDVTAAITVRFGRREASVSTNRFDDESLRESVRLAERLARLAPEDPELMPELGPQTYRAVSGFSEATAGLAPEARGGVAAEAISRARAQELVAAGFLEVEARATAVADSQGLFAYHAATDADYDLTVRTSDGRGSGWAGAGHRDWRRVDAEALHRRAIDKALRSRAARPMPPGRYATVLEPAAVSELVGLLDDALDARRAEEGRSAFSAPGGGTRLGEQIVDERVTLRSDPEGLGSSPFQNEGLPLGSVTWIQDGRLARLSYDRFWAERSGEPPTGSPGSLRMAGEPRSLEDLIAGMERGVLVTRLWYIRSVDPRTILHTGLTRDGTFWVEQGEIRHPINNFRWNDSPLSVLRRIEAMSRPVRVTATREVPALRVSEFNFTSVSEAV